MMGKSINQAVGKAVLVTGCSSGIGRATAAYLAEKGFAVFATVRKSEDADNLKKMGIPNLIPICPLDLTKIEQISGVLDAVQSELTRRRLKGLFAVIHNAGGGSIAPIELMDVEGFRTELETRLVGPVALTQALLPLIRHAEGRILWIATPALLPIKFVSGIHAPDFAVNCLVRTLNLELAQWRIPAVMIRCGGVKTSAPGKSDIELKESFERWTTDISEKYKTAIRKEIQVLSDFEHRRSAPETIAQTVYRALCDRRPKIRYQTGYMSRFASFMECLPQAWIDSLMAHR